MKRRLVKKWLKRPLNRRLSRKLWNEKAARFTKIPCSGLKPRGGTDIKQMLDYIEDRIYKITLVPKKAFE